MKYWLVVFGIVLVSLTGSAIAVIDASREKTGLVCTLMGCGDKVRVEWRSPPRELRDDISKIRLCVDSKCEIGRINRSELRDENLINFIVENEIREERTVLISVALLDRRERELIEVSSTDEIEMFAPNGVECGPVCYIAEVRVRGEKMVNGPSPR